MASVVGDGGPASVEGAPVAGSRVRAWITAIRPKTLSAGLAPVAAGFGLATAEGVFAGDVVAASFICVVFLQMATNLANDYFDFVKGADTAERLGPMRATQAGLLSPTAVFLGMSACLVLAAAAGGYLAGAAGWPVFALGAVCLACAVGYTGGPWPLAYHGLGDLFVFVFFGPVATAGSYYVQTQVLSADAILAGIGLGAFSTAILVVNNLRDRKTDAAAGKRTLAVRFGDRFAACEYLACLLVALLTPVVGLAFLGWSPWLLITLVAVLNCLKPATMVAAYAKPSSSAGASIDAGPGAETGAAARDRRELNAALAMTARCVLMYGLLLATGFMSAVLWG